MRSGAALPVTAVLALLAGATGYAHIGITSKFTYNTAVYPIFLNRCGRCHIDGGVGPMSLLKYEDSFPWAESIRIELLSAYPDLASEGQTAKVDPHDFVKSAHRQISARELDIVLDWARGGTPEGDKAARPEPPAFKNEWPAGEPSVRVAMTEPYHMQADAVEDTQEFTMPVPNPTPLEASRLDLLPGTPAIVRSAVLSLKSADGTTRVLGTWFPRQTPGAIALKPAVRVDPGSHIVARIHYKKPWKLEGEVVQDRSTIGLYAGN
jgi:hypothetical protein